MSNERVIDGLVAMANPVQHRRVGLEIIALVVIAAIQLVGTTFYFGWNSVQAAIELGGLHSVAKMMIFGLMAAGFSGLALWSLSPSARRNSVYLVGLLSAAGIIALIGLDWTTGNSMAQTFYPQYGVRCVFSIVSLALPVTLLLSLFMARGASTQPNSTALYVGLAGGSWGAFSYALQCPFVSIWYLGVWYMGGVALIAIAARLLLPRIARW